MGQMADVCRRFFPPISQWGITSLTFDFQTAKSMNTNWPPASRSIPFLSLFFYSSITVNGRTSVVLRSKIGDWTLLNDNRMKLTFYVSDEMPTIRERGLRYFNGPFSFELTFFFLFHPLPDVYPKMSNNEMLWTFINIHIYVNWQNTKTRAARRMKARQTGRERRLRYLNCKLSVADLGLRHGRQYVYIFHRWCCQLISGGICNHLPLPLRTSTNHGPLLEIYSFLKERFFPPTLFLSSSSSHPLHSRLFP